MAVVECRPNVRPSEAELLAWSLQLLAAYKAPRRVFLVEQGALPQGVTEKVLKRVLRERYTGEFPRTS